MSEPLRVIGFGHPLLDISTHVDIPFLEKYKVVPGQTTLALPEQLPVYAEIKQRDDVIYVPGGATMNAIRVCQWLSKKQTCSFSGTLGDDDFGKILVASLKDYGVTPLFDTVNDFPTGTCACLIAGKERSLLANLGAALRFTLEHLNSEAVQREVQRASIFYSAGFFFNTISSPQSPLQLAKHCADNNKIFSMNLSAPYLCSIYKEAWVEIMPFVDYLFGNKNDAAAYSQTQGWGIDGDHVEIAIRLVTLPKVNKARPRVVIITHGSDPTVVATPAGVTQYDTPDLPPDSIVDLNGAGDAFVGGFLSGLSHHKSLIQCIRAAQYCASTIIRNNGCTFPKEHSFDPDKDFGPETS